MISPAPGTYTSAQMVTISEATPGVTIFYTTDGSTPTTASPQYKGPITVAMSGTIQAIAAGGGFSPSAVATAAYTIAYPAATPVFSIPSGIYPPGQTVSISDATAGATIYYTTDGTTPTTSSLVYIAPIGINGIETIEAIAAGNGFSASPVASVTITIAAQIAAPTFSPPGGTYAGPQMVSLSDSNSGVTIYYTTNGMTPTTSSPVYVGPILVNASETIEAFATLTGFAPSTVATARYMINPPPDFQVSVNPTTLTIVAGQSGQATFTVTPENGFNSQVTLSCGGLPAESGCSFTSPTLTLNGMASSTMLTITTTAPSSTIRVPSVPPRPLLLALFVSLVTAALVYAMRQNQPAAGLKIAGLWVLLAVAVVLPSCGGGSGAGNTGGGGGRNPGTPAGTTTITVSAASSGAGGINHGAPLTVIVTQ